MPKPANPPGQEAPDVATLLANDFQSFKTKDETWFLSVAADVVREYCGWHICPVVSDTLVPCEIGNRNIIMLPSLNVVSIEELAWWDGTLIPEDCYEVHPSGWLELRGWYPAGAGGFVAPRAIQTGLRGIQNRWVRVNFTHGFESVPKPVSEVLFELAAKTMEKPAGIVSDLTSGPYRFKFNEFGAVLSEEQRHRLGPYCIERV